MASFLATVKDHWRDPLYRNGYLLMLNSVTGAAFGFAFWLVVARAFAADEGAVGYGAAVISAMTGVALVAKMGLDAALIRFAPQLGRRSRARLLAWCVGASGASAIALGLVFLLVVPRIVDPLRALAGDAVAGLVFIAGAAAIAVSWVLDGYFVAERSAARSLWRNLTFNVVKVALPFLALFHASALGIPAAWAVAVAASIVLAVALVPPLVARAPHAGTHVPMLAVARFSAVNAGANVAEFLPGLVLPLVVLDALGAQANGFFYIAWSLAFVAFLASRAIAQSTFAEMSHDRDGMRAHLRKAARQNALVIAPFVLGALALGRPLLGLFGESYARESYPVLGVLALSAPFVAVIALYSTLLKARSSSVELVVLPVLVVTGTLATTYALLGRLGLGSVAAGWLAANATVAAYAAMRLSRAARQPEPHHVSSHAPTLGDSPH